MVSAVALSLIMALFTEPAERAKAMGVFGFVAVRRRHGRRAPRRHPHRPPQLALDLPRQHPDRRSPSSSPSLRLLPGRPARGGEARLDVGGAVTVTASLMLAVYAIVNGNGPAGRRPRRSACSAPRSSAGRLRPDRVARGARRSSRSACSGCATSRRRTSSACCGRRPLRVVLPLGAVPAARARLQPAPGRARVPALDADLGRVLARPLGQARHALRDQAAARGRPAAHGAPALAPVRARAGRRQLRRRHPARRCCSTGFGAGIAFNPILLAAMGDVEPEEAGPRVGRRQHRVHDGRRARAGRPGERRRVAHATSLEASGDERGRGAQRRLPPRVPPRRAARRPRRDARSGAAASLGGHGRTRRRAAGATAGAEAD